MQNILKSKIFISAVLAVAAIAAAVVIGVSASRSGSDLQAQLDLGEVYFRAGLRKCSDCIRGSSGN